MGKREDLVHRKIRFIIANKNVLSKQVFLIADVDFRQIENITYGRPSL